MNTATALYKALHKKRAYTKLYWDVANTIGIHQALLVEIVERWCELNQEKGKTNYFQQGEWWTSATYQEWAERYPALGGWKSIQRTFLTLEKENYILSGKFTRGSQTKYYRVNPEAVGLLLLTGTLESETGIVSNSDGTVSNSDGTVSNSDGTVSNSDVLPYIDQIIQKDHSRSDHSSKSPYSPPRDINTSEGLVEVEVMEAGQEAVDTPSLENPKESSLLEQKSNPGGDKISRGGVATKKNNNTRNEALEAFLEVYRIEKPSNFTNHPKLSDKHVKVLSKLTAKFKERSLDVFTAALIWCREGDNSWWYKQRRSLDNLMSNGKIEEYADNHFDALEADPAYRDRVEGRAASKDPKRNNGFQVFNEQGKEVTGASARAAAAVASDPMLALFLEQI